MDEIKRKALEQLLKGEQKLSPDDFTRPGEMIPKDAGLMDFLRYNAAHFNPGDPETAMSMGMGSGGINKIGGLISHSPATANAFHSAINAAQEARPMISKMITKYTPEEYEGMKTFLSPDKLSGYAIKPDGELVSVFSAAKGRGSDIIKHAIENGATKLDAFDGYLPKLYAEHGFEEVGRSKNFTEGEPDVVFMERKQAQADKTIPGRDIPQEEIQKADRLQQANEDLRNMMGKSPEEFQRQMNEPFIPSRGTSTHIPPQLSERGKFYSENPLVPSDVGNSPIPKSSAESGISEMHSDQADLKNAAGFHMGGEVKKALMEHLKRLRG